jgi:raffinose/stachyose/melibiose transport system permease protein
MGIRSEPTMRALRYILLLLAALYVLFPLLYILSLSLRKANEMFLTILIPKTFTLTNYIDAWLKLGMVRLYMNSIIVNVMSITLTILVSSLAAYAFSKKIFRGKPLFYFLLVGMMIPNYAIVVPLFLNIKTMGLLDTYFALIFPYAAIGIPLSILILRDFFRSVPSEIEEAAVIDGATTFRVFWNIMLPLSRPAIGTLVVLNLLRDWNELIYALTFIQNEKLKTITAGLVMFSGQHREFWGQMSAAIISAMIPIVVVYFVLHRKFIEGIALGAVKQ